MAKRGHCDYCDHPRWQHSEPSEPWHNWYNKCKAIMENGYRCYCSKYKKYKVVGEIFGVKIVTDKNAIK